MDDPKNIVKVSRLKIRPGAACSMDKCLIYANGRNQVPIEIEVEVQDANKKPLHFDHDTWFHLLSLRHATTNERLNCRGVYGLNYTDKKNDYSQAIVTSSKAGIQVNPPYIMLMYVYTTIVETTRIAVSIDTEGPNGKHCTTADSGIPDMRMSVTVDAINQRIYQSGDLVIHPAYDLEKKQNEVTRDRVTFGKFDCHYDNYYIDVPNGIRNANIKGYGPANYLYEWICVYDSEHDNQHMIVAHPFRNENGVEESNVFGFENTYVDYYDHYIYDLTQLVKYNEYANQICFTQMFFNTGSKWFLPDNDSLDRNKFSYDPWFELYDIYGNYGKFSVGFDDDHKFIKISNR